MQTELPHWDFDRVVQESRDEWNQWLSRIEVEGGAEKQQRRFYTDLWKALQGRRIVSDVNGKYLDMTGKEPRIGQIPLDEDGWPLFNHHNSDSFWGAQWSLNTLWHLVYPEVSEDFVNSMLMMYDDGGLIPRGPSGGNYTYVMTGASTTPFIVSAWLKGIRGFDVEKAYEGMRKNHFPGGLMSKAGYEHETAKGGGIEDYMERGYIPYPFMKSNTVSIKPVPVRHWNMPTRTGPCLSLPMCWTKKRITNSFHKERETTEIYGTRKRAGCGPGIARETGLIRKNLII